MTNLEAVLDTPVNEFGDTYADVASFFAHPSTREHLRQELMASPIVAAFMEGVQAARRSA